MIKVKLKNGFEVEIDENRLDDMRFVEALAAMDDDMLQLATVVRMIFGDQKEALYKSLETEDGRVPLEAISEAIAEVMEKGGEQLKNSQSSPG